jgi:uncharacterized membrane protein
MNIPIRAWLVIAGAALLTYALRLGGLLLADRLPQAGPCKRFLDALPGTILLALVAPGVYSEGLWGTMAIILTVLATMRFRNVLFGMLVGMAAMAFHRNLLG